MNKFRQEDLTVILPLKGRESFTKRWLNFHNDINLPWPVSVGDGDPESKVTSLFENDAQYKNLKVKYKTFHDINLKSFYKKLWKLIQDSDTPYILFADNDDFIMPGGVQKCIDYLDHHSDFVSCGSSCLGVKGNEHLADEISTGNWSDLGFMYQDTNLSQGQPVERIDYLIRNYMPLWYSVHRRDALEECMRNIVDLDIEDVLVMELYQSLFMASKGKVKQLCDTAHYMRQRDSSMVASSLGGMVEQIFEGRTVHDSNTLIQSLAEESSKTQPSADLEENQKRIKEAYYFYMSDVLSNEGNSKKDFWGPWIYTFRMKLKFFQTFMQRRELSAVEAQLKNAGMMSLDEIKKLCEEIKMSLTYL